MAGCSTSSAAAYENCGGPPQGLLAYSSNQFDSLYSVIASRNKPAGSPADFAIVCEACLRARGIIYYKNTPGDCPAPPPPGGFSSGQIVGLSGQAASGVVGGLSAAGALAGPATLGISTAISLAVGGIEEIFAHHAAAVADEQSTICGVAGYFNPLVKQIDAGVVAGTISPDQGIVYMKQITNQAISGLQSIYKVCNAACVYQGILRAFADFASTLYPAIAPIPSAQNAPASAPSTFGTPPGGVADTSQVPPPPPVRSTAANTYAPQIPVPSVSSPAQPAQPQYVNAGLPGNPGASDNLNLGYNQQTGQSGQLAPVPPTIDWSMVGTIVAIVALLITVAATYKGSAA